MMMNKSLAVKYRPRTWDDVTEQRNIKVILQNQLKTGEIKNAYLFSGSAGCGKTTCARIFAQDINKGVGNPLELDAASNNGVDDVREIIQQAQTKSLSGEYKIFIIDECHALSNNAWQAMLKLSEEPPLKTIFIFCTTDPQKIPKTILSRVQRFDFQRISVDGIVNRLRYICDREHTLSCVRLEALEYIAKVAEGGLRDAITLLDKCIAYSSKLTLQSVLEVLGAVEYDLMIDLSNAILKADMGGVIQLIEGLYLRGKDLKLFVKQYIQFLLDVQKYDIGKLWEYMMIPRLNTYEQWLDSLRGRDIDYLNDVLSTMINLSADIKYSSNPRYDIEAALMVNYKLSKEI